MDKKSLLALGLLAVVILVSLEWLRSGPSSDVPPEEQFVESASQGDMHTLLDMLELGVDLEQHGPTALMYAAHAGRREIIEALLDRGVDIDARVPFGRPTALIVAARAGQRAIVETLLARGAEVNAKDAYGQTALYFARKNSHARVIEVLEAAGGTAPPLKARDGGVPLSDV